MNWVMVVVCTTVVVGAAFAQFAPRTRVPVNGGGRGPAVVNSGVRGSGVGMRGQGLHGHRMRGPRIFTNVHQGPDSLHRPWIGSETYDKNLGSRSTDNGRSDFQRDRDAALDTLHHEEDRARSIRNEDAARAEKMQSVRENKALIEANARAAAAEQRAREAELNAEIRARAAELEADRRAAAARTVEMVARHDEALAALKPCRAYNDNGKPCPRKANPGMDFCYLHVSYSGRLQGACDELPEVNSNGCLSSSELLPLRGESATVSVRRGEAPSSVAESSARDLRRQTTVPDDASNDLMSQGKSLSDNLLVIIVVSLLALLVIGVLGGLALGFYAICQRRGGR